MLVVSIKSVLYGIQVAYLSVPFSLAAGDAGMNVANGGVSAFSLITLKLPGMFTCHVIFEYAERFLRYLPYLSDLSVFSCGK